MSLLFFAAAAKFTNEFLHPFFASLPSFVHTLATFFSRSDSEKSGSELESEQETHSRQQS